MRRYALIASLAVCMTAFAVTPTDDIVLQRADVEHLLFKLQLAEQENLRYDMDRAKANRYLNALQQKIEELEARKCL